MLRRALVLRAAQQQGWRAIADKQQATLADDDLSSKLRTDLTDSLQLAEDAGEQWQEEAQREQESEHASRARQAETFNAWQAGQVQAGGRETARDRDERMHQEGSMESNRYPPHPQDFEEIVRRVRYANLMPLPEAPAPTGKTLFISEAFPVLTSLVDRLLSLPGVTVETLTALPIHEHDKLIEAHYEPAHEPAPAHPSLPPSAGDAKDAGAAIAAAPAPAALAAGTPEAAAGDAPRGGGPDEVFAGQAKLMAGADDEDGLATWGGSGSEKAPAPRVAQPQRQRLPERALTASQTVAAVATLCSETEESIMPSILTAVGQTKNMEYLQYYWSLAHRGLEKGSTDTAPWDAYIDALSGCGTEAVEIAYNTVEEMKDFGVTPSVETWNSLMKVYTRNYDSESALKVAENMRMYANLSPNHTTFLRLLQAHVGDQSVDANANARRALNVMYEMTQVYRMEATREHYAELLRCLALQGNEPDWYLEIQTQAQQMKHLGMPWSLSVYETLMWVEGNRGDIDKLRELFVTLRKRKLPATDRIYSAIIQGYANAVPQPDKQMQPNIFTWARKQREEWELNHSTPPPLEEWRERMHREGMAIYNLAKQHDGPLHRTRYCLLRLVATTKPELLRDVWEEEVEAHAHEYPRVYNTYISGLAALSKRGDPDALDDAEQAFIDATRIGLRLPRAVYVDMMEAHITLAREGSVDVALDYMRAMEKSGQTMPSSAVSRLRRLIDEMGPKRDDIRRAKQLMERRQKLSDSLYDSGDGDVDAGRPVLAYPGAPVPQHEGLTPDGFAFPSSATGVNADGTLTGESYEDRAAALAQMGFQPMNIRDAAELREGGTKVTDWLSYSAANPSAQFAPGHASFDRVLANNTKVGEGGGAAVNAWHRERMAENPAVYREDGTLAAADTFGGLQEDSPTRRLVAMKSGEGPTDAFDVKKPYFDPTFAHKAHVPSSWTPDQEAYMKSFLASPTGQAYSSSIEKTRELRSKVLRENARRARKVSGSEPYPDEL